MYDLIQAGENTYYIDCPAKAGIWRTDRGVYLIDSGGDKDAGKKLRQILEKNGWPLLGILNTHSHADHVGGTGICKARPGAGSSPTALRGPLPPIRSWSPPPSTAAVRPGICATSSSWPSPAMSPPSPARTFPGK